MSEATLLAPLAMLVWGPLTLVLFSRLSPPLAASISIIGASILLPARYAWNFEGLPAIDRDVIAVLFTLLGCVVFVKRPLGLPSRGRFLDLLAIVMVLGGFMTVLTNGAPVWTGGKMLPGMPLWSVASRASFTVLAFWVPLYLGRILFRSPGDLRTLLRVLAVAGILYSLPALWEARMSPQLHSTFYGYAPHDFAQHKRSVFFGWGWRPMVFVGHGIALTQFVMVTLVATVALWRQRVRIRGISLGPAVAWIYLVLILCQSLAAVVYATVAVPFLALARLRWNRVLLASLLLVTVSYPVLRANDLFPTQELVAAAALVSEDRAASLQFRFQNEDVLLDRALERPWFGWGGFGRERIYDDFGRRETVSDGYWIIAIGQMGSIGFVCAFGMMLFPPAMALGALRRRKASNDATTVLAVTWILVLCSINLIPNGFLSPWFLYAGGAVVGALSGWQRSGGVDVASERFQTRNASFGSAHQSGVELRDENREGGGHAPQRGFSLGESLLGDRSSGKRIR